MPGARSTPTRSRNASRFFSGTRLRRSATSSIRRAFSSISPRPGSLLSSNVVQARPSVASATQYCLASATASATGSRVARSYSLGGCIGAFPQIERIYEVEHAVGGAHAIFDIDHQRRRIRQLVVGPHTEKVDARLPFDQRVGDGLRDQAPGRTAERCEHQIAQPAAEIRAHHPFALCRSQDDENGLLDLGFVMLIIQRAFPVGLDGETPATSEMCDRHQTPSIIESAPRWAAPVARKEYLRPSLFAPRHRMHRQACWPSPREWIFRDQRRWPTALQRVWHCRETLWCRPPSVQSRRWPARTRSHPAPPELRRRAAPAPIDRPGMHREGSRNSPRRWSATTRPTTAPNWRSRDRRSPRRRQRRTRL